ncbi:MAG: Gfo/Idh/MocA family oxidoreductase [Ruminococcaceae bacterium]|nr:Gfo/Idh/MocA family oxidoreductase [Oscillospiraceae bacterium]
MEEIRLGVIGLGGRGRSLMKQTQSLGRNVVVTAVCDEFIDRAEMSADIIEEMTGKRPELITANHEEVLNSGKVDCVIVSTSWEDHIRVSCAAMRAGVPVGCETGGAYSVEDCYELVRTYEETKTPFMLLENCCYGQMEMLSLKMKREGLFGKISHCTGGYGHDLRSEIIGGYTTKHYRLRNYMRRNCDNYPQHQLGPICKILDINKGNRLVSLVSIASKGNGIREYLKQKGAETPELVETDFCQGDVINTIITCAGGETILLTLDTTLPRNYSRFFSVRGTKGGYFEGDNSIYLEDVHFDPEHEWDPWKPNWGNAEKYFEEYKPDIWAKYGEEALKGGHNGMDYLVLSAFFESVKTGAEMPVDVYDAATWMSISALSEASIACGGAPVAIPDFTRGRWIRYKKDETKKYSEFDLD